MSWKIIYLFALWQLASVTAQNTTGLTKRQRQVQTTILEELVDQTKVYWRATLPENNIQLNPLAMMTSKNVMEIRSHYEGLAALYFPKNRLLEIGYAFANTIDALQQTSNVKLKLNNAIFYDQKSTHEQYLNDVKTRYHAEAYEVSFEPNNTESIVNLFDEWMNKVTKGKPPNTKNPLLPGMTNFHTTVLTFSGCWDQPKNSLKSVKKIKFKTINNTIEVPTLNAKESIGYYDNATLKYEAIRIPYKNEEFAMVVVLPYYNHSIELFSKFSVADYQQLLERVNENHRNIDYAIPLMNATMIMVNESGTSLKGNDPVTCDWSSRKTPDESNKNEYKLFYADRPYGIIIYEEKTKYVLSHTIVKNPNQGLIGYRKFTGSIAPREKGKYPLIPTYVVFY